MQPTVGGGRCDPASDDALKALVRPDFALADARAVCGMQHLRQAARLAQRAHALDNRGNGDPASDGGSVADSAAGYALARTPATEVLLYLTGQRQVSRALAQAGLRADTTAVAWVAFGGVADGTADGTADETADGATDGAPGEGLPEPLPGLITRDDAVLTADGFDFRAFGLPQAALDANPRDRWPALVLARCALLPVQGKG